MGLGAPSCRDAAGLGILGVQFVCRWLSAVPKAPSATFEERGRASAYGGPASGGEAPSLHAVMKAILLLGFLPLAFAVSCSSGGSEPPSPTPTPSLRSLAQARGIAIGAAVGPQYLRDEPAYAETLGREFSMLTPENAMKFGLVHPDRDRYDFTDADYIVDFAEAHGMQVRGHNLVWHFQLPTWLTEGTWTRDELIAILHEHITTVVGHYRGRVAAWDVVNEAVGDDGSLRDTIWLRGIGPEYVDMAFRWAHEADPDALLFYNDYAGGAWARSPTPSMRWCRASWSAGCR